MQLKLTKETIDKYLDYLKINTQDVTHNNVSYKLIYGLNKVREAIYAFGKAGLFEEIIKSLKESVLFEVAEDQTRVTFAEANSLIHQINSLYTLANNLSLQLSKIVGETSETSIYIKFPDFTDFSKLSKAAQEFHKVFTLTVLDPEIGGEVNIKYVENGSAWWEVDLGNMEAVSLIAAVTYAAAYVWVQIQKGLTEAENRRTRKITNEYLQKIQAAHALLLDDWIDTHVHIIQNEHFKDEVPERENRLKNAINILSGEFLKGAIVQASLATPQNTAKEFPDMKNPLMIIDKIKEITDKPKDDK